MSEFATIPYHHNPRFVSTRPRCPVCNASVFSPSGIHPQCAAKRYDDRLIAERKAVQLAPPVPEVG